jgi:shikimate dehydrogenase
MNSGVVGTFLKPVTGIEDLGPSCLIGLIGAGIQHSLAPAMQMREGTLQGLRYLYNLIDTTKLGLGQEDLPDLVTAAQRMGYNGLAVTHPFKQTIIPLLDELSDDARALGAVNTVVLKDGKKVGHNADWYGFYEGFVRALPDVPRRRAVQLGAGGAGAAVAHAAMKLGIEELNIFDIESSRADHEVEALNARFGKGRARLVRDLAASMAEADGLIHCTPVGMGKKSDMAIPKELLRSELWVAEIVYFPLETELLRTARALGCRTANGGGMLVFQAAEQMRLFSGAPANGERMLEHFNHMASSLIVA